MGETIEKNSLGNSSGIKFSPLVVREHEDDRLKENVVLDSNLRHMKLWPKIVGKNETMD